VKFRRKAQPDPVGEETLDDVAEDRPAEPSEAQVAGPYDADDFRPSDGAERIDLGSLLIAPEPDRELRLQVDEASGTVQSVVLAGPDGALELRAFAAPRGGDLWSEARPQIAAEVAQAGGTATERQGPWGTELICQVRQRSGGARISRVVGINGPRWMLRASLLGAPATQPEKATGWEDSIRKVVVNRGREAMPVGEALPVAMPPQARRVDPPTS